MTGHRGRSVSLGDWRGVATVEVDGMVEGVLGAGVHGVLVVMM